MLAEISSIWHHQYLTMCVFNNVSCKSANMAVTKPNVYQAEF